MLEIPSFLHDAQEYLLGHVFRGIGISQVPQHEVIDLGLVTPDEASERIPVAALVPHHQQFVADAAQLLIAAGFSAPPCLLNAAIRAGGLGEG